MTLVEIDRGAWMVKGIAVAWMVGMALAGGPAQAQPLMVSVAGSGPVTEGGFDGDTGPVASARFDNPEGVAVDGQGRILVCDRFNHRIRRIDLALGVVETVAGSGPTGEASGTFSGDGGPATSARLNAPVDVAVDGEGNLFIADQRNHRIRRVDAATGIITTVAGSGSSDEGSFAGDGGPAMRARLSSPRGVAVDATGNLYIADTSNHRVRRVDAASGLIETIAGDGPTGGGFLGGSDSSGSPLGSFGGDGGPATEARLNLPASVRLDEEGNLYVADLFNARVRRIDAVTGFIETVAGNGIGLLSLLEEIPATETGIGRPFDLAVSSDGTLFVAPGDFFVYRVDGGTGLLTQAAGNNQDSSCPGGAGDGGPARGACLKTPRALALDAEGDLLICDTSVHRVRKVIFDVPEIVAVEPATASTTSTTAVTLRGRSLSKTVAVTAAPVRLDESGVEFPAGPAVSLTDVTVVDDSELSATLPAGLSTGTYNLVAVSADGAAGAVEAGAIVRVQEPALVNRPPVIQIFRPGRSAFFEQPFVLDATPSFDPDLGDTLSYHWTLATTVPGAATVDTTSPTVPYLVESLGLYEFQLSVADSRGATVSTVVTLFPPDVEPIALLRSNAIVNMILPDDSGRIPASLTTDTVLLDGSLSLARDTDPIFYSWTLISTPEGSTATTGSAVLDPEAPVTRFRLSAARGSDGRQLDAGEYLVRLRVSDPDGKGTEMDLTVTALSADELAPTADAGVDARFRVRVLRTDPLELAADVPDPILAPPENRSAFVRLDGRQSFDPNDPPLPLTYEWSLLSSPSGSTVTTLTDPESAAPRFVPDRAGNYSASLQVRNTLFPSKVSTVKVIIDVVAGGGTPAALPVVRSAGSDRIATAGAEPLAFTVGEDTVVLDASASTDPDREDRAGLEYRWGQTFGLPVSLSPSSTSPVASFAPPRPGRYGFALSVLDPSGASSLSEELFAVAVAPGQGAPSLSIVSSASSTSATGGDLSPGGTVRGASSLRVSLPALITLEATAANASSATTAGPGRQRFFWRQTAGAAGELAAPSTDPTTSLTSVALFAPTTARVHLFECRVVLLDAAGEPSGPDAVRQIRVLIDSAGVAVPTALAAVSGQARGLEPGSLVTLDGGGASSPKAPGKDSELLYRWTQVAGPPVVLSDPYSAVTTFVVPDPGDSSARDYQFSLFVEDASARSEAAPVTVAALAALRTTCAASLSLSPGLNLISLPVEPLATGGPFDSGELIARAGARFVVRTGLERGEAASFDIHVERTGRPAFTLSGNRGYLLGLTAPASVSLDGLTWSASQRSLELAAGVNLVAYPQGVPAGETASALLARTGAGFVARLASGPPAAFEIYLPEVTPDFSLETGRGYLISVPSSRSVSLPSGSTTCP